MTAARAVLLILTVAGLAAAHVPARSAVPLPRPKPPRVAMAAVIAPLVIPVPHPKPRRSIKSAEQASDKAWPRDYGRWPVTVVEATRARCMALFASRDIIWRPDQPIGEPGGCGTAVPIAISEVSAVRINPPATMNCDFAAALADWIDGTLQPAARKAFRTPVTEIRNASSYACRRRNNARSGKLSEHAKANALDIAGFTFANKSEVTMKGQSSGLLQMITFSGSEGFLKTVRKDACRYFNTVLGPGSDPFHKDHMHLDLMKLRPGRFKLCH